MGPRTLGKTGPRRNQEPVPGSLGSGTVIIPSAPRAALGGASDTRGASGGADPGLTGAGGCVRGRDLSADRCTISFTSSSGSAGAKLPFAPSISRAMQSELRIASSVASMAAS